MIFSVKAIKGLFGFGDACITARRNGETTLIEHHPGERGGILLSLFPVLPLTLVFGAGFGSAGFLAAYFAMHDAVGLAVLPVSAMALAARPSCAFLSGMWGVTVRAVKDFFSPPAAPMAPPEASVSSRPSTVRSAKDDFHQESARKNNGKRHHHGHHRHHLSRQ